MTDPLRTVLSDTDNRLLVSHWMPPQSGIAPRIRTWLNLSIREFQLIRPLALDRSR